MAQRARHERSGNPATLVRSWPYVTNAARKAQTSVVAADVARTVERIAIAGDALHQVNAGHFWPGPGGVDPALGKVSAALSAAAKQNGPIAATDVSEAADLIASTLWITAEMVAQRARDHAVDLRLERHVADPDRHQQVQDLATDAYRRITAAEQLASGAMRGPHATVLDDVAGGLVQAVADWDIQAHRALLTNRSTTVLHVLGHQEAALGREFSIAIGRAGDAGVIDQFTAQRLEPILAETVKAWKDVIDVAAEFSWGSNIVPRPLATSAEKLNEQFRSVALQPDNPDRHRAVLGAFAAHLSSSVSVTAAARDLIGDDELRGPARAVARVITDRMPELQHSPVNPVDIHRGVSIVLPPEARDLLRTPTDRAYVAAEEAMHRAAGLDALYRSNQPSEPTVSDGVKRSAPPPIPPMSPSAPDAPTP